MLEMNRMDFVKKTSLGDALSTSVELRIIAGKNGLNPRFSCLNVWKGKDGRISASISVRGSSDFQGLEVH